MPTDTPTLTTADAFELLGNERRRTVLRTLPADGEPVTLRTLALAVAFEELGRGETDGGEGARVDAERYRRTFTALYHADLPKLTDAGAIEYDDEDRTIRRGDLAAQLERYLP